MAIHQIGPRLTEDKYKSSTESTVKELANKAVDNSTSGVAKGLNEGLIGTVDGFKIRDGIDQLDSKGDSAFARITSEVKTVGNVRLFKVGVKGQNGGNISVTRDSDAPDTTYTVRYDKQALAAVVGEGGTDAVSKLAKGQPLVKGDKPGANLKAELGVQSFDAVEMRFATKEEAAKAVETLSKLHNADMVDDALDSATRSVFTPHSVIGTAQTAGDMVRNPFNTMDSDAINPLAKHITGLDTSEVRALSDNVVAYESTVGGRGRLAAEVKGDLKLFEGAIEGRLDGTSRITKRVELPTANEDGSVVYTVSNGLRASAKERANKKHNKFFGGMVTAKLDNRVELARGEIKASFHYNLPKGENATTLSGRTVQEADPSAQGNNASNLQKITYEGRQDWQNQGLQDISRGDIVRSTQKLTINNPENATEAISYAIKGDFKQAADVAGAEVEMKLMDIDRSGTDIQPGAKIDAVIGEVEVSTIFAAGVDDIKSVYSTTIKPGDEGTPIKAKDVVPSAPDVQFPPEPQDDNTTYVVRPTVGVNVRDAADGNKVSVVQNGSFMKASGARQTDTEGKEWVEVSGTDLNDKDVKGWVRSDLLEKHDSAVGAMDDMGRYSPKAEYNRMDVITVEKDDNLWNLAKENGWDFQETLEANKDHLLNPSLIFKGDKVYAPNTARGPEAIEVPKDEPVQTFEPGKPVTHSVETKLDGKPPVSVLGLSGVAAERVAGEKPPVSDNMPEIPADGATMPKARQDKLDHITNNYKVADDQNQTEWQPRFVNPVTENVSKFASSAIDFFGGNGYRDKVDDSIKQLKRTEVTQSEAQALDNLNTAEQFDWAVMTRNTMHDAVAAFKKPDNYAGGNLKWENDGHVDAYRHALWSARMTKRFGSEWTKEYTTSHEMTHGNPVQREAMDLYNNEVGRQIAIDNPDATDTELQTLAREAVMNGEVVVIDQNAQLNWSDRVKVGEHRFLE